MSAEMAEGYRTDYIDIKDFVHKLIKFMLLQINLIYKKQL